MRVYMYIYIYGHVFVAPESRSTRRNRGQGGTIIIGTFSTTAGSIHTTAVITWLKKDATYACVADHKTWDNHPALSIGHIYNLYLVKRV